MKIMIILILLLLIIIMMIIIIIIIIIIIMMIMILICTAASFYKNNGSNSDCGNYRGISLLSIAGMILIILNHLISFVSKGSLPVSQRGIIPGCSTINMFFSVYRSKKRALSSKWTSIYTVFVNRMKGFDMLKREAVWVIPPNLDGQDNSPTSSTFFPDGMIGLAIAVCDAS